MTLNTRSRAIHTTFSSISVTEGLHSATLTQNLGDPSALQWLLENSSGAAPLERTAYAFGLKAMSKNELITAIQDRVVAFAPFIEKMGLSQMEFVVAPPVEQMPLEYDGAFGDINELNFR